jgi:hydrogenase maturation protease
MRVLVAGIGNIFLGDDGFGVAVAQRMSRDAFGAAVTVADFGIRGIHLAFELASGRYDAAILVDAVARGGQPGTLFALEPDLDRSDRTAAMADAHTLTPDALLVWLREVDAYLPRIVIIGCEPETVEELLGLSPVVAAAVDPAIEMIRDLVAQMSTEPVVAKRAAPRRTPCV